MLKRGFKSQCERRSVEVRKSFGLTPRCPLSAKELADQLGVAIWKENDVEGLDEKDILQLTVNDPKSWSALTMRVGLKFLIVFNSSQSPPRINSVLMHELSHITLGHELTSAELTEEGYFVPINYNQEQEQEANWLAGTLLLPRPALLNIRYRGMPDDAAMLHYQVSRDMLTWRFRMTGVDYQIENARKKHGART